MNVFPILTLMLGLVLTQCRSNKAKTQPQSPTESSTQPEGNKPAAKLDRPQDQREFLPLFARFESEPLFLGAYELLLKADQRDAVKFSLFDSELNKENGREITEIRLQKDGVTYRFSSYSIASDVFSHYDSPSYHEEFTVDGQAYQLSMFPAIDPEKKPLFAIREFTDKTRNFFVGFEVPSAASYDYRELTTKAMGLFKKHAFVQLYTPQQELQIGDRVNVRPSQAWSYYASSHDKTLTNTRSVTLTNAERTFRLTLMRSDDPDQSRNECQDGSASGCSKTSIPIKDFFFEAVSYGPSTDSWGGEWIDKDGRPIMSVHAYFLAGSDKVHTVADLVKELSSALEAQAVTIRTAPGISPY